MKTDKNRTALFVRGLAIVAIVIAVGAAGATAETLYLTNTNQDDGLGGKLSELYLIEIDEVTGSANALLLDTFEYDFADGLACSPDDLKCYLIDKYDTIQNPDGGSVSVYDTTTGTTTSIGELRNQEGDLLVQIVAAAFSPGPTGGLYVASQTEDLIYSVDLDTVVASPIGQILVEGTDTIVDLDGADMVFTADSRWYVWTNAERLPDAPRGLYEITAMGDASNDSTAIYLGVGLDGLDPDSHRFTGLAVRENGLGDVVGSNRFDELHQQSRDGQDVDVFPLLLDGDALGHGSGDMHHSFDCFLAVDVLNEEQLSAGSTLRVEGRVVHNRPSRGAASPVIWIEDETGLVVQRKKFPTRTFQWGDDFRRTFELSMPQDARPGEYTVWMSVAEMRQGRAAVSAKFTVR